MASCNTVDPHVILSSSYEQEKQRGRRTKILGGRDASAIDLQWVQIMYGKVAYIYTE